MRWMRWFGIVGVLAAATLVVADALLVYTPLPASQIGPYAVAAKPDWRIYWGYGLGLVGFPLVLAAVGHIWLALRRAPALLSLPPVLLTGFGYVTGACFHSVLAFHLVAIRESHATAPGQTPMLAAMDAMLGPLRVGFQVAVLAGVLWLLVAIASGKTAYPRWVAWVSPFTWILVFRGLTVFGPPEIAGFFFPTGANLSTVAFIGISTALLWKGEARRGAVASSASTT